MNIGILVQRVDMCVFRKFLVLSVFLLTPFTVFGTCEYSFSELYMELGIPGNVGKILYHRAGIRTVDSLVNKTERELMEICGFKEESLVVVKRVLYAAGRELRSEL